MPVEFLRRREKVSHGMLVRVSYEIYASFSLSYRYSRRLPRGGVDRNRKGHHGARRGESRLPRGGVDRNLRSAGSTPCTSSRLPRGDVDHRMGVRRCLVFLALPPSYRSFMQVPPGEWFDPGSRSGPVNHAMSATPSPGAGFFPSSCPWRVHRSAYRDSEFRASCFPRHSRHAPRTPRR